MIISIIDIYKAQNNLSGCFVFWFNFRNKKELIRELNHRKRFFADGRTSYRLIENRFNGVEK